MKNNKTKILSCALVLVLSIMFAGQARADAKFFGIWLEHNVMHNGQQCLAIHFKVIAYAVLGNELTCVAYVECPKGMKHRDVNHRYCTSDGQVAASRTEQCVFTAGAWDDFVIYLPNNEIHPKSGKNDYYIHVEAWAGSILIGSSDYVSFSMTGNAPPAPGNAPGNGGGNGGEGSICAICFGTGRQTCNYCQGAGWTSYLGTCINCQGTGKHPCLMCGGTGWVK